MTGLGNVRQAISAEGLAYRGAFHPVAGDLPDGRSVRTLVLVGTIGRENWNVFAASREAKDGAPDPLDRWSRRVISGIAKDLDATAFFPFDGPPWYPFQRWAQRAEPVHSSPLGMLIHPDWGLWHSWRGALAFRERFDLPEPERRAHPCESCFDKPCLTACPAGAFTPAGYNVRACVAHIDVPQGIDCIEGGCRARRACPIGAVHRYGSDQAGFHMRAFRKAQK